MKRFILLLISLLVVIGCKDLELTVLIKQETIRKLVYSKFPIEVNKIVVRVKCINPYVYFKEDKVGITFDYTGNAIGKDIHGVVDVLSSFYYEPIKGELYLRNFDIATIKCNDGDFDNYDKLKPAFETVLNNGFDLIPVYKLDTDDAKQAMAKATLKSAKVIGKNLAITFGL